MGPSSPSEEVVMVVLSMGSSFPLVVPGLESAVDVEAVEGFSLSL